METYTISPGMPFNLEYTVLALRRLPVNTIDRWDGKVYRRVLAIGKTPVEISVEQNKSSEKLEWSFQSKSELSGSDITLLSSILEKILGLNADLSEFRRMASEDPKLSVLAGRFVGLKPPRFPTVFEAAVNGIACQQLSLNVGILLLGRLAAQYGLSIEGQHAFPRPLDLVRARFHELKDLGFSSRKTEYILGLAGDVVNGRLDLDALESLDNAAAVDRLMRIRGIGRWTAEYVLLRGLGRLDTIPADDVGIRNKLKKWLNLSEAPSPKAIREKLSLWDPYRGMIYFLLLLDKIYSKDIEGNSGDSYKT